MAQTQTARIVVGVDGSPGSGEALRWAIDEARRRDAIVEVVHAWHYPYVDLSMVSAYAAIDPRELHAAAQDLVNRVIGEAHVGDVVVRGEVIEGPAAPALVECAKGADLLVVGSRGRGGFGGLLLGSVSQQVAHHAPCPLVIVPEGSF